MCQFGKNYFYQLILLFNLFLLLFIGLTALFDTIYVCYCTILVNFYFYLQDFQQNIFSFNFSFPSMQTYANHCCTCEATV